MKRTLLAVAAALPLAVIAQQAGAETFVRMLAGPAGGSWYPTGAKIMEIFDQKIEGISTSNGPGAGVGNVRDVDKGNAEIGWTFGDTAYAGYTGTGAFKQKHDNIRYFATLYPGVLQTAVPANSDIKSYKDLVGKNLSPGKLTFSGNIAFEKLLKLYGITYDAVTKAGGTIHRVSYTDSVALMKDGHVDAFVGMTTLPNSSFLQLDFQPGIRLLGADKAIVDKFVDQNPGFFAYTIPKGAYKGVKQDTLTLATGTVLVVSKTVPDELVYKMQQVFWDSHDVLAKVNPNWSQVTLKTALLGAKIPVHPGAQKYYDEHGVKP